MRIHGSCYEVDTQFEPMHRDYRANVIGAIVQPSDSPEDHRVLLVQPAGAEYSRELSLMFPHAKLAAGETAVAAFLRGVATDELGINHSRLIAAHGICPTPLITGGELVGGRKDMYGIIVANVTHQPDLNLGPDKVAFADWYPLDVASELFTTQARHTPTAEHGNRNLRVLEALRMHNFALHRIPFDTLQIGEEPA